MSSTTTATIYDRVAAHAVAYARFESSCDPADESAAKNRGATVSAQAIAQNQQANDEEIAAFDALLSHVPSSIVELRRQLGYISYFLECRDTLDREQLDRLFSALMAFRPRRDA